MLNNHIVKILFLSFTCEDIGVAIVTYYGYMIPQKAHWSLLENIWLSSEIFGKCPENVRKSSSFLRNNFEKSSEIFRKWSEIFGKSSKTSSLVWLYNKQNITCPLVDMNFIFSCSTRYQAEHSKIKFISTRGHVISSMSLSVYVPCLA